MDRDLLAFRLGSLEPPDQLRVEERLRTDPLAAAALLTQTEPLQDAWRLPPQGYQLTSQVLAAQVFRGSLRPGDRFVVALQTDDSDRFVVVLYRTDAWRVVFPTSPDGRMPLERLRFEDGAYHLELTAAAHRGQQDWAVALPREEDLAQGWEGLQERIAAGHVPVTRVSIEVG